jgi:alkylation response protein AidB-like acyl-CoA dehydrogenase
VDLELSESELAFRAEARDWLAANVPAEPLASMDTPAGWRAHQAWEARLAADRWSVVSWPRAYHGREASLVEWILFEEEYYRAGAPGRVSQNGIFLLAPIIFEHGTPEQQDRFLPSMATGECVWAQCWSEPEAGSDLASLRSTARRDDERGGWVLNGQKTWSSRASFAHWGFGLFRSDPEAERHRGLTYFLFPLDTDGVTVRPIAQLDGEPGFAEVFFDEVFVPDADVLGAPGDGWRVAMSTAGNERGLSLRSPGRFCAAADRLVDLYRQTAVEVRGAPATSLGTTGSAAGDRVVDAWIKAEAYRLYTWGTVTRLLDGGEMGAAGSVNKVWWSELDVALHETALDLLGPEAEVASSWLDGYLFSLSGPIYAGTNEIQRNIVAERILGLPREPKPFETPARPSRASQERGGAR